MENIDVWIHIFSVISVLVFTIISTFLSIILKKTNIFHKFLLLIVMISAILLMINRNTYLPFLGSSAVPYVFFQKDLVPEGATITQEIHLKDIKDGSRLIYWGANKKKNDISPNPKEAYGDYSNAGVTEVKDNKATLLFHCPNAYNAFNKTIDRHIHYRIIDKDSALLSPVYTIYVKC